MPKGTPRKKTATPDDGVVVTSADATPQPAAVEPVVSEQPADPVQAMLKTVLERMDNISDRLKSTELEIAQLRKDQSPENTWPSPQERGVLPSPQPAMPPQDTTERDRSVGEMLKRAAASRGKDEKAVAEHEQAAEVMLSVNPATGEKDTRRLRRAMPGLYKHGMPDPHNVPRTPGFQESGSEVREVLEAAPSTVVVIPLRTEQMRVGLSWYFFKQGQATRVTPTVAAHLAEKGVIATGRESVQI